MSITAAILTVSDTRSSGQVADTAGPALAELLRKKLGATIAAADCVADDVERIAERLRAWAGGDAPPDLVLTTGGTGLAPRDVTPEATMAVMDRPCPGLCELMRLRCLEHTPLAFLSRAQAGVAGRTLIINLPGSPKGAAESLEALLDVLPHAVRTLRGESGQH